MDHRLVRCNHCMTTTYEENLIKDDTAESGELCPVCRKSDALMDVESPVRIEITAHCKMNMECINVRGGCVQGFFVLSAEDTDYVCRLFGVKDEDREKTIFVRDYDVVDDSASYCYKGAHWDALNRVYELK